MIDVAIVGAGPAGCAAANLLAKKGYSVTIFEKDPLPRYKSCGGGVAIRCLKSLYQLGVNINEVSLQEYKGFTLSFKDISAKSDLGRVIGWGVYRKDFDYLIAQSAMNNGAKITNKEVLDVKQEDGTVRILTNHGFEDAKILLAADGIRSNVRKALGISYDTSRLGFCLEAEVKASDDVLNMFDGLLHLDFSYLKEGFFWAFPKKEGNTINIGAGGYLSFIQKSGISLKDLIIDFAKSYDLVINQNEIHGALLPFGGTTNSFGRKNCLLLGDAAGLASPMSGEGIPYALESGIIAANCVNKFFEEKSPVLESYTWELESITKEINKYALTLQRRLFGNDAHRRRVVELCKKNDELIDTISKIFIHIIPYEEGVKRLSPLKILTSTIHIK